jgi:O-Antigen ligase
MQPTLIVLGLVGMLAFGILSVARPGRTILPLYAALVPAGGVFELSLPIPAPFNTLSSVVGTGVIIAILAHVVLYRRGRIPRLPVGVWAFFVAWITATAWWAIDRSAALDLAVVAWPLALLMIMVSLLPADERDLDAVRLAVIASGSLIGSYALFLLLTGSALGHADQRFAIAGGAGDTDPNILAASLLIPLALSVERVILGGHRWLRSRSWRLLGSLGALLSMLAIVSTGSRGGVLAAGVAIGSVLIVCRRRPQARRAVHATLATVLIGGVVLLTGATISVRLDPGGPVHELLTEPPLGRLPAAELGGSGRLEIWLTGYRLCGLHCGAGSGLGTFPSAYNEVFAFSGAARYAGTDRPAHSIYIELAVEAGVIGFTLLCFALLAEWSSLGASGASLIAPSLGGILLAILVANIFLSTFWFKYFWLVLILIRLAEGSAGSALTRHGPGRPARLAVAGAPG